MLEGHHNPCQGAIATPYRADGMTRRCGDIPCAVGIDGDGAAGAKSDNHGAGTVGTYLTGSSNRLGVGGDGVTDGLG